MSNMMSYIRDKDCQTPIVPDNPFSKTHRMIKKETKTKTKVFYIWIATGSMRNVKILFSIKSRRRNMGKGANVFLLLGMVSAF